MILHTRISTLASLMATDRHVVQGRREYSIDVLELWLGEAEIPEIIGNDRTTLKYQITKKT